MHVVCSHALCAVCRHAQQARKNSMAQLFLSIAVEGAAQSSTPLVLWACLGKRSPSMATIGSLGRWWKWNGVHIPDWLGDVHSYRKASCRDVRVPCTPFAQCPNM